MPDLGEWAPALARAAVVDGLEPADVLAGLAAALGAPWDGPGSAAALPVDLPRRLDARRHGPGMLDAAREALLAASDPARRRRLGAHHTPPALARRLTAFALDGLGPGAVVADPACGGGAFLVAAAELLVAAGADPKQVVRRQLHGAEVDAVAAATSAAALALWAGLDDPAPGIVVADSLIGDWCAAASVDAVVGNPPFLSPLSASVATSRGVGGPYADAAGQFLVAALELVRDGGRVVLVLPESFLAARDAAPLRRAVLEQATLEGLWVAGELVFGAAVRVCAPVLRRGAAPRPTVRRWSGAAVRSVPAVACDPEGLATWAPLRPSSAPSIPAGTFDRQRTVGHLATASAGFRDEFYGLAAAAAEARDDDDDRPRLVTSGLIDPGGFGWGRRPARLGGRTFAGPVLDRDRLEAKLAAWVGARLVPKVLVATQTRVVEAAPDPTGRHVPVTPVIAVVPHDTADVWRVAAALTAPAASAWALHHYGGTALDGDAIKLSTSQVLAVPLPADGEAWEAAATALAAGDVDGCAGLLSARSPALLAWWQARRPAPVI